MNVIRALERRVVETPNAVMTTFASPALGGAARSLWQVRMVPGATGPWHRMSGDQVWTVLDGGATVESADGHTVLGAGDTAVLPAGELRRLVADPGAGLTAVVTGDGDARAGLADGTDRGVPEWIA
ncbi:cupin domain-containing protein [Pseudonocardia parietis]|uniref:Quercetin dioxygenase-like cupin family protein n=1 Tax=Pseudonocardia parietis TaxID=570936 RepID=A0ABS4VQH1_9PSEU|nr:cupin domain-containing protein [Pseudonocardia parietis]MBP2366171.1 quercetin dioxygenase-like cupin family protein [Pseudonocardia parietis]